MLRLPCIPELLLRDWITRVYAPATCNHVVCPAGIPIAVPRRHRRPSAVSNILPTAQKSMLCSCPAHHSALWKDDRKPFRQKHGSFFLASWDQRLNKPQSAMSMTEVCTALACWSWWWPPQKAEQDWRSSFTQTVNGTRGLSTISSWEPNDLAISAEYWIREDKEILRQISSSWL